MDKVNEAAVGLPAPSALANLASAPTFGAGIVRFLFTITKQFGYRLNRTLPKDGSEGLTAYTEATKPTASSANAGAIIYVSDGGAGKNFQGSNGTSWVNLG